MKKLLIPFVIGAVLGLGGSTVAVGYFGGGDASLADGLAAATADSSNAEPEHADSSTAGEHGEVADSTGQGGEPQLRLADTIPVLPGTGGASAGSMALATANGAQRSMETSRLAKLFASMQAREAAEVMEHMDDFEVRIILAELGNREAAAILSNLTPERAAVISQAVIRGERSIP